MAQRKHPFQALSAPGVKESHNDPQESEVPGGPAPSNPPYPHPASKQAGPPQGVSGGAGGTGTRDGLQGPAPDDGADVWHPAPGTEQIGAPEMGTGQLGKGGASGAP